MDAAIPFKLLCDMALWLAAAAKRLAALVGGPLLILTASAGNGEG